MGTGGRQSPGALCGIAAMEAPDMESTESVTQFWGMAKDRMGARSAASLRACQSINKCHEFEVDPALARLRSMRKGIELAYGLACLAATREGFRAPKAWMVTLTYAKPERWEPCHVTDFRKRLRAWADRRGIDPAGVWCAEMQDKRFRTRGELAIHYHVVVWLPQGITPPKPDKQGWWRHGHTKVEAVRKAGCGYIMKYASKGSQAPLPKGARIHGHFGLREQRRRYTHSRRPSWLRERCTLDDVMHRRRGGGWINSSTGECCRSPWKVYLRDGRIIVRRAGDEHSIEAGQVLSGHVT